MNNLQLCLLVSCLLLFGKCQSDRSDTSTTKENPAVAAAAPAYPSIPDSTMQYLWQHCDFVDYIFYELDFSVSQDDPDQVRRSLQHVSRAIPKPGDDCRPIGRLFYQVDGENALEADIYFSSDCQYYLFYRDGQPAYANAMTPAGIQFYEYLLTQVGK